MKGHVIATGVWLALIAGGYFAFDRLTTHSAVDGCDGGSGALRITAAPDGHFHVDGSIDGVATTFVVDTGASTVTVGGQDARRIGLSGGSPATFRTAAGTVQGSMVRTRQVRAACLAVDRLAVAISPPMDGPALLGQNFLRHFEMVVNGREMTLRPRTDR